MDALNGIDLEPTTAEDPLIYSHLESSAPPVSDISINLKKTPIMEIEPTRRLAMGTFAKILCQLVFKQDAVTIHFWLERLSVLVYPNGPNLLNKYRRQRNHRTSKKKVSESGAARASPEKRRNHKEKKMEEHGGIELRSQRYFRVS
jgi:hypothetical protein